MWDFLRPRPGGIDAEGREVLSYIAGESGAIGWYRLHGESGLRRFATLLLDYHEAVRDFRPSPDLEWALGASDPQELICHNDFGPWNLVYDGDEPVGILDWDFATPGPGRNDVGYALEYAVPFPGRCHRGAWHHFAEVPDRRARLEVFADAYGLTSTVELVDDVIARQRLTILHVEGLAARGLEPQATWVRDGTLDNPDDASPGPRRTEAVHLDPSGVLGRVRRWCGSGRRTPRTPRCDHRRTETPPRPGSRSRRRFRSTSFG